GRRSRSAPARAEDRRPAGGARAQPDRDPHGDRLFSLPVERRARGHAARRIKSLSGWLAKAIDKAAGPWCAQSVPKLLALGVALLALWSSGCASDLSAAEARRLVQKGARLLDVRSPKEFAERHIEGSLNLPVEDLKRRVGELGGKNG